MLIGAKISAALKTHRKTCMYKRNFSIATMSRSIFYFFPIKQVVAVLAFSFLFYNANLFTSCKEGDTKCEEYVVYSLRWV